MLNHTLYKLIFWTGYAVTLMVACLPISGDLSKIKFGVPSFEIRLDHLLHFGAYFLICLYFIYGRKNGLELFKKKPLKNFIVAVTILGHHNRVSSAMGAGTLF